MERKEEQEEQEGRKRVDMHLDVLEVGLRGCCPDLRRRPKPHVGIVLH